MTTWKRQNGKYLGIQVSSVQVNMIDPLPFDGGMQCMSGRRSKVTTVQIAEGARRAYEW